MSVFFLSFVSAIYVLHRFDVLCQFLSFCVILNVLCHFLKYFFMFDVIFYFLLSFFYIFWEKKMKEIKIMASFRFIFMVSQTEECQMIGGD